MKKIRETIQSQYPDDPLLFMDPADYDKAIIGIAQSKGNKPKVTYDVNKVIKVNIKMGMTEEESWDFFFYNQESAYVGEYTPLFLFPLEK